MKEIKLRQWDDINRQMNDHRDINVIVKNINNKIGKRQFIYLLYTGLNDNKGNSICEGDFLRHDNGDLFLVFWSDYFASFALHKKGSLYALFFQKDVSHKETEIIGNYYKNPDLIKEVLQ